MSAYTMMATDVAFTKMSANVGINKFWEQAVAAMFKDFKYINEG